MGFEVAKAFIARHIARTNLDVGFQKEIALAERNERYNQLVETKTYLQGEIFDATGGERENLDGWIVCGSGLKSLSKAEGVKILKRIPVSEVPHWFSPEAEGHGKELIIADVSGQLTVIQTGRGHIYDIDSSPKQIRMITAPVVVAKGLGIDWMVITNAAGVQKRGDKHQLEKGDVAVIVDYVNQMGVNSLVGPNDDRLGMRFPPKTDIVDPFLFERLVPNVPEESLHLGIYTLASNSPTYEGGADLHTQQYPRIVDQNPEIVECTGMSYALEAIEVLHHNNPPVDENGFDRPIRLIGISAVTNTIPQIIAPTKESLLQGSLPNPNPTDHKDVLEGAALVEKTLIPAVVAMCSSITGEPLPPIPLPIG